MRFMLMFRSKAAEEVSVPPCKELAEMRAFMAELSQSGVLLATEGLQPSAQGARVHLSQGNFTVTDGPFTEAKELVAGFALVEVDSKEEAIDLARKFLSVAGEGQSEIREVI